VGLLLKKEKGVVRPWWYGEYRLGNGKRTVANLGVRVEGKPPQSGRVADRGDAIFERSRKQASDALNRLQGEARGERMTRNAAMRQYQERTGEKLSAAGIHALQSVLTGETLWRVKQRKVVEKFVAWANEKHLATVVDIRVQHAREYLGKIIEGGITAASARKIKTTISLAFDLTLPDDAVNPFRHKTLKIKAVAGDVEHHREPLTQEEVDRVISTGAVVDPQARDWMVCALSTGLRLGDVCRLQWKSVDLKAGTMLIKTSKTGTGLHLPILPALMDVFRHRKAEDGKSHFVFPEAERIMRENSAQLTTRVKKVFVAALAPSEDKEASKPVMDLSCVLCTVSAAVAGLKMGAAKRGRMERVLRLYADGKSYDEISRETEISQGCVSDLLTQAEEVSGVRFVRRLEKWDIGFTRVKRIIGKNSASRYDFHCLRTTFVTLAISAGMSADKLRALTGHSTVDVVLRHYFKPRGVDFADELKNALPESLTKSTSPVKKSSRR